MKNKKSKNVKQKIQRYFQIEDLRNNENIKYCITGENTQFSNKKDVIIAWDGANAGTISYGLEGAIGSTLAVLKLTEKNIYTPYIGKYLQSRFDYLRKTCTDATIPHISKSTLRNLQIPLPPLPIQKKIAEVLDKADYLRQKRKEAIRKLDELAQSIFLDMFGDPVTNPKGWEVKRLEEVSRIETGSTPRRDDEGNFKGSIPWIKTTEVTGTFIYSTLESITENGLRTSNCKLFPVNTILIAMYGQGLTRGRVGMLKIDSTSNQACAAIYPTTLYNSSYLFELLKIQYHELRNLGRGGNQPNLNLSLVKKFEIILPPITSQQQFAIRIEKIQMLKEKHNKSLTELNNLFNSLMQRAFKGELEFED